MRSDFRSYKLDVRKSFEEVTCFMCTLKQLQKLPSLTHTDSNFSKRQYRGHVSDIQKRVKWKVQYNSVLMQKLSASITASTQIT